MLYINGRRLRDDHCLLFWSLAAANSSAANRMFLKDIADVPVVTILVDLRAVDSRTLTINAWLKRISTTTAAHLLSRRKIRRIFQR
ncbi:MAG: hypothetical protein AAB805_01800 [Patescibacteria group bacterium]